MDRFPVWSIEDGLAEGDWDGWVQLTEQLGSTVQLVGDDIFVTNPAIISDAIRGGVGNAALITVNQIGSRSTRLAQGQPDWLKVNQTGTVTETLQAMAVCRGAGYAAMVSHRSGETEDSLIADPDDARPLCLFAGILERVLFIGTTAMEFARLTASSG